PSGSRKMWWLCLSAKRTTLSSMLGQYRGPVDAIWPEYIGARCRLARMISWIRSFVAPIQQWIWGRGGRQRRGEDGGWRMEDSAGASALSSILDPLSSIVPCPYSLRYENGHGSASPGCSSNAAKSIV